MKPELSMEYMGYELNSRNDDHHLDLSNSNCQEDQEQRSTLVSA